MQHFPHRFQHQQQQGHGHGHGQAQRPHQRHGPFGMMDSFFDDPFGASPLARHGGGGRGPGMGMGMGMSLFGGADPFANDPFFAGAGMGGGMSMGGGGSFSSSTSSFSVGANGVRTGKTVRTSATIDSQGRRVTRTETTTLHPDGTSTSTVDERVDGAGAGPRIEDQRHGSGKRETAVQLAPQPASRNSFTSPFSSWGSKF